MYRSRHRFLNCLTTLVAVTTCAAVSCAVEPNVPGGIHITGTPAGGVVAVGQVVQWTIERPATVPADGLHYQLKENNLKLIAEGDLTPDQPTVHVDGKLDSPGWLILSVVPKDAKKPTTGPSPVTAAAGVVADPEHVQPALAMPDDFNAFWTTQVEKIKAVPPNAVLKPVDSGQEGVDLFEVTLDNVDGAHTHAQLARPAKGDRFPAIVIYQAAGVYQMQKSGATSVAANGWLVLNVSAHDLPIYQPKAFYDAQQTTGPLKGYTAIGAASRDTSYFRHMFLGDYQAIQYLTSRPDWNGQVLVARGESQGGLQSFAMAALHPKVTQMIVSVPAGCDTGAVTVGRAGAWPYWPDMQPATSKDAILNTSRYYDAANFAASVHCPALVTAGLLDVTATPTSVIAAYNRIAGPKQLVVMPEATHRAYHELSTAAVTRWLETIKATGHAPERVTAGN